MNKQIYNNIVTYRDEAVKQFIQDFDNSQDYTSLLQSYARYVGKLEALLDMVEVHGKG